MEGIIYKTFGVLFQTVGMLILTGVIVSVLTDLHKHAFESKQRGLVSMLNVNRQLTRPSR